MGETIAHYSHRDRIEQTLALMSQAPDFDAARRVYESWAQIYPRDEFPVGNLGVVCVFLDAYDGALASDQEARRLNPGNGNVITNVASALMQLNRLEEAKAAFRDAQALHVNPGIGVFLYAIGFLEHERRSHGTGSGSAHGQAGI